jgi:adenosylcobinamide kinase/adenosylcobinamide-phosphate guanylyltransferase
MTRRTLVLGGVRSGKSLYAEGLARADGRGVTVVATATADDAEMAARIAAHRARRPPAWSVIETPIHLVETLQRTCRRDRVVIVDCLTLWITNLVCSDDDALADRETRALCDLLPELPGGLILVSNETSLGIVPTGALTRRYLDCAGALHRRVAVEMDRVVLLVAGLPLTLKGSP